MMIGGVEDGDATSVTPLIEFEAFLERMGNEDVLDAGVFAEECCPC